jgi:polyhydroxybutyrate depolymerase
MLMIHGTADPVVPYDDADAPVTPAAAFWTRNNGCAATRTSTDLPDTVADFTTVTRHDWQQCPDEAPVVLYDVVGGGHTWPGGIPFLPPPALGWHTYDISANAVIWDFVSRFTRPTG